MNLSRKALRRVMNNKSQSSHQIRATVSYQSPFLHKKNQTYKCSYFTLWWCDGSQHEIVQAPDQSKKIEKFAVEEVFEIWWDWRRVRRGLRSNPLTRKFKVITCENNSSNMFLFWTSLHLTESYHQMKLGREFTTRKQE